MTLCVACLRQPVSATGGLERKMLEGKLAVLLPGRAHHVSQCWVFCLPGTAHMGNEDYGEMSCSTMPVPILQGSGCAGH